MIPGNTALHPRSNPHPPLSPRLQSRVTATCPATSQSHIGFPATAPGGAGDWRSANGWSPAIGAALPGVASGRRTIAASAAAPAWSDLGLSDQELRVGSAPEGGEAEPRGRDRRRISRRARDDGELPLGVGGNAEGFGAKGDGVLDGVFVAEGPTRGVPGKGRNAAKRNARKAKDYGMVLVELKRKELQRVVSWMELPEETLEAVLLAQAITRRGKNGWRRQLSYVGGLLRGVSEEKMDEAIAAAKSGILPSFVEEESEQGDGAVEETEEGLVGEGYRNPV